MSERDRNTWNRLAARYDGVIPWFASRYDAVRERMRHDLAGVRRLLEVGAGTGQFTLTLAETAARVTATDIAPEMVVRLGERIAATGVTNVEVREASVDDLGFDDGSFDAVVCANVLHVVERPRSALHNIARVLQPGGLLVAPTFCHGENAVARWTSRLLGLVSPFEAHTRFSARSLREFVEERGFAVEQADSLGGLLPLGYLRARSLSD